MFMSGEHARTDSGELNILRRRAMITGAVSGGCWSFNAMSSMSPAVSTLIKTGIGWSVCSEEIRCMKSPVNCVGCRSAYSRIQWSGMSRSDISCLGPNPVIMQSVMRTHAQLLSVLQLLIPQSGFQFFFHIPFENAS